MPPFSMPIGSVVKAQVICRAGNQISVNTHKWQMLSIVGGSTISSTAFLADLETDLLLRMPPLLGSDAQYYGTMLYLMNPIGPAPRPDNTVPAEEGGTGGAGLLPMQCCGLISWYTAVLGKQGQGRTYVPFPSPEASETNGSPNAGYISSLAALSSALRAVRVIVSGPVTATFELVLYQGGIATPLVIVDATERDAWATQRRRGSYGKANSPPF